MGLRLRDDFEIRYDSVNSRTILENLNTGNTLVVNDDGTVQPSGDVLDENGNPLVNATEASNSAPVQDVNGQTGSVTVESPTTFGNLESVSISDGVTYTNDAGNPIELTVGVGTPSGGGRGLAGIDVDGSTVAQIFFYDPNQFNEATKTVTVPKGSTYTVNLFDGQFRPGNHSKRDIL